MKTFDKVLYTGTYGAEGETGAPLPRHLNKNKTNIAYVQVWLWSHARRLPEMKAFDNKNVCTDTYAGEVETSTSLPRNLHKKTMPITV